MKNVSLMKSLWMVAVCGAVGTASAYQGWNGKAGNGLLSDPGNWGKNPVYGGGGDSNLGGFPDGTYTLNADMTANRIVFDKAGKTATFDLRGHTLTLVGQEQIASGWAFGVTGAGSESTLRLTSGTISAPWAPQAGVTYTNCYFKVGREVGATNFAFVVDGVNSKLAAGIVSLADGNFNTLVITNGATCEIANALSMENAQTKGNRFVVSGAGSRAIVKSLNVAKSKNTFTNGNGVVISDGGVLQAETINLGNADNRGNYIRVEGPGSVLMRKTVGAMTVGASVWSRDARLDVLDGGTISNINLTVGAGNDTQQSQGSRAAFRGTRTHVTLQPTTVGTVGAKGATARFEVTDGATLAFAGANKNNNRLWVGTSALSSNNTVLVSGAGSKILSDASISWLVGQHGPRNCLRVTDGGYMQINSAAVTIGQGDSTTSKASENCVRVDDGGAMDVHGQVNVGWGTLGEASSNRLEIVSDGSITNSSGLRIGASTNAHYSTMLVSDGVYIGNGSSYVGCLGHNCRLTVENGGVFSNLTSWISVGQNLVNGPSSNAVEILSGGSFYTAQGFNMYGYNPRLVVSNGTLVAGSSLGLCPNFSSNPVTGRRASITVAGNCPKIRSKDYLDVRDESDLHFVVPEEGYDEPVFESTVGNVNFFEVHSVTWDISPKLIAEKRRIVLARASAAGKGVNFDDQSLAAFRANLPDDCRIVNAGHELILKAGLPGMTIIFR